MKYINKNTGAIIDSPSKIIGKAWKLVDAENLYNQKVESISDEEEVPVENEEYVEEEVDLEAMTRAQLISFAKEQKIEINEKDNKPVIIETIAKAFE